jgi:4-amino-4-deoxy-L-arabinose transferase-like glycosyltransferase
VSNNAPQQSSRSGLTLIGLCALALALRLAIIYLCRSSGVYSDMVEYQARASLLLEQGFIKGMYAFDAWRIPGYSIFLWAVYSLGGNDLAVPRIVQTVLGVGTVALTYVLARRMVGPRQALAAALVVAIYPALLIFTLYIASETLFTALLVTGLWLWLRGGRVTSFGAGLAFAFATLTRAVGLAAIPAVLVATLVDRHAAKKPIAARLALFFAAYVIVFTPWIVRNAQIYGRLIPLDTNSGFLFLVGNNPEATGRFVWEDQERLRRTYYPNATTDAELSAIALRAGLQHAASHPHQTIRVGIAKIGYLFGLEGREHVWLYSIKYFGGLTPRTLWAWGIALLASFPLLMIPALVGMLRPGLTATPAGAAMLTIVVVSAFLHFASFGDARYHVPLVPILAIFAARTVEHGGPRFTEWNRWRHVALVVLLLGLVIAWQSQLPLLWERLTLMATAQGAPPPLTY